MKDYYETLEVSYSALSQEIICNIKRKLYSIHLNNFDDVSQIMELNEASNILLNKEIRRNYDEELNRFYTNQIEQLNQQIEKDIISDEIKVDNSDWEFPRTLLFGLITALIEAILIFLWR